MIRNLELDVRNLSQLEDTPLPDRPGLYAWFLVPRFGRQEVTGSSPARTAAFISVSENFLRRLRLAPLDCIANTGNLVRWRGRLSPEREDADNDVSKPNQLLVEGFKTSEQRAIAQKAFTDWPLLLTPPIYVGKAKSLKTRLKTHKRLFDKLVVQRGEAFAPADEDEADAIHLAGRLVERDISDSNELLVAVFPLDKMTDGISINDIELDNLATALEYVINHATRPILGRR